MSVRQKKKKTNDSKSNESALFEIYNRHVTNKTDLLIRHRKKKRGRRKKLHVFTGCHRPQRTHTHTYTQTLLVLEKKKKETHVTTVYARNSSNKPKSMKERGKKKEKKAIEKLVIKASSNNRKKKQRQRYSTLHWSNNKRLSGDTEIQLRRHVSRASPRSRRRSLAGNAPPCGGPAASWLCRRHASR